MPFVKQYKNSAYFSRYQVKYRRRREGKTDYQARRALTIQAKDKYNAPKYRLVVRFSNKYVTVQIVSAKIQGDVVFTHASSRELPRYGIKHGLSNWTASEFCVDFRKYVRLTPFLHSLRYWSSLRSSCVDQAQPRRQVRRNA
jgi:hypothetical protein